MGRADAAHQQRRGGARRRRHRGGAPGAATSRRWRPRPPASPRWKRQRSDLLADARAARRAPVSTRSGPFANEAERHAGAGRARRASCARGWSPRPAPSPSQALVDLDQRLRELLRQARLTHIDAIIGKKKKLEIEIANLREGRYPAEMFATLQLEGLIGDDEEYWPFEGEYWADEYENYK